MRRPISKLVAVCLAFLCVVPPPPHPQQPAPLPPSSPSLHRLNTFTDLFMERQEELRIFYEWASSQPREGMTGAQRNQARASGGSGSHRGYASAKECVSMVENGGDYGRSSNPSHFGRYQFSRGTWAAYGGTPETWGTASPAEQDAVFETAWNSPGGPNHWLPYDGCG